MQTILKILHKAGGWYPGLSLKIENLPYGQLILQALDTAGPCGLPALSVGHLRNQSSGAMYHAKMCFELSLAGGAQLNPFYWRDYLFGSEQRSRFITGTCYAFDRELYQQHIRLATAWDRNLRLQGFAEVFDPTRHMQN